MAILEAALQQDGSTTLAQQQQHGARTTRLPNLPTKSVEQIAAELRALFPEPVDDGPRSVDIVREMRDAR